MQNSQNKKKRIFPSQTNYQGSTSNTLMNIHNHYYNPSSRCGLPISSLQKGAQRRKNSDFQEDGTQRGLSKKSNESNQNSEFTRKILYENKLLHSEYEKIVLKYSQLQKEHEALLHHVEEVNLASNEMIERMRQKSVNRGQNKIMKIESQINSNNNSIQAHSYSDVQSSKQQNIGLNEEIQNLKRSVQMYKNQLKNEKCQKQILMKKLLSSQNEIKILWQNLRKIVKKQANSFQGTQKQNYYKVLEVQNIQLKAQIIQLKTNHQKLLQKNKKIPILDFQ